MNNINNPVLGSWMEAQDAGGWELDTSTIDEELTRTTYMIPFGNVTETPAAEASFVDAIDQMDLVGKSLFVARDSQFHGIMGTEHQLPLLGGETQTSGNSQSHQISPIEQVVENTIRNFNQKYEYDTCKYEFHVEHSDKRKNKPYEVKNNCIVAKRGEAIKINLKGPVNGHTVKMSMRFKDETNYEEPVMACKLHMDDGKPNKSSSFHVVCRMDTTVRYEMENGHITAIMDIPSLLMEPFSFSPIFRCRNSCNSAISNKQQMIFRLCDKRTGKVLKAASFDIRVCENVGRDSQIIMQNRRGSKRLQVSSSKKMSHRRIKKEEHQEGVMDPITAAAPLPHMTSHFYMVELDDELLPILKALVEVRGKKLVQIDPDSMCVIGN